MPDAAVPSPTPAPSPSPNVLPVHTLRGRKTLRINLRPGAGDLQHIKDTLDLLALRKVSLEGALAPDGKSDWQLTARLGATAVQPCSVTLEPVTTRVDTTVVRRFVAQMPEAGDVSDEDGVQMHEDETLEPLGREIDLIAVLSEALALALPDYPRAAGADLGPAQFTETGARPMTDDDAKPFAGLAALKGRLEPKD